MCCGLAHLGAMECTGLATIWEGSCEIRDRLRQGKKFLEHPDTAKFCEATRPNCVDNACILKPALKALSASPAWKLPHIAALQVELSQLFHKLGANPGELGVYKPAVEIKKLLGFVKRRAHRREVTKERGQNNA